MSFKNIKINVGGVWKEISFARMNIGGVWKNVIEIKQNIDGIWKTVLIYVVEYSDSNYTYSDPHMKYDGSH